MAINYGITFCKKILANLKNIEDRMIEKDGRGFDQFSAAFQTEKKYKRLLEKFEREKELGLPPSYNPEIHGSPRE